MWCQFHRQNQLRRLPRQVAAQENVSQDLNHATMGWLVVSVLVAAHR